MKDLLHQVLANLDARRALFDDRAIGMAWAKLAKAEPSLRTTTAKGVDIGITRSAVRENQVEYRAYVDGVAAKRASGNDDDPVAWMYCSAPMSGRVQVTNANVYEIDGIDWRRKGIGMAMYDVIERDVLAAEGQGLEPHWGSMSDEAIAFWETRRPEWKGKLAGLNRLGVMASGLFD